MYVIALSKLSIDPAPGVHIFRARCMIFKDVHPDGAQSKSLISDTGNGHKSCKLSQGKFAVGHREFENVI